MLVSEILYVTPSRSDADTSTELEDAVWGVWSKPNQRSRTVHAYDYAR